MMFDAIAFAMGKAGASRDLVSALMGGSGGGGGSGTLEESGWVKTLTNVSVSGNDVDLPSGFSSCYIALAPSAETNPQKKFVAGDVVEIALTVAELSHRLYFSEYSNNGTFESKTGLFTKVGKTAAIAAETGSDVLTWHFNASSNYIRSEAVTNTNTNHASANTAKLKITGIRYNGELIFGKV